jgi:hypothetical protein
MAAASGFARRSGRPRIKVSAQICRQVFLNGDQLFGGVLSPFVGSPVFVEIAAERFDAHIAAVGHQIGYGAVARVEGQLHVRFQRRHCACHCAGTLAAVAKAIKLRLQLGAELPVLVFADDQSAAEPVVGHAANDVIDGRHAHPNARVTFAEQADRIGFNQSDHSFPG